MKLLNIEIYTELHQPPPRQARAAGEPSVPRGDAQRGERDVAEAARRRRRAAHGLRAGVQGELEDVLDRAQDARAKCHQVRTRRNRRLDV